MLKRLDNALIKVLPLWARRLHYRVFGHLGYWTQDELDEVNRRAKEIHETLKRNTSGN